MTSKRTCLDCGFVTIQGRELSQPERIMLSTLIGPGGHSAVMPAHPEQTRCFKNLWDYDLLYSGDTLDGVIDEIGHPRDKCNGFASYEAGFTPIQHLENEVERRKEKLQWRMAKLSFWGAVLGGGIVAIIIEVLKWLLKNVPK